MDEMENGNRGTVRQEVPVRLKSKIYRTVVVLLPLRIECWPTTKALERVLHAMEMRMLRWTIGVTLKKVSNDTVRSIFGVVPITEKMKEARLRWFGPSCGGRKILLPKPL
ncbi:hypothetical protein RB195_019303 [Necator americanus]|uniref:Reverse transcriptase domain-containing protein n=1 Tax=Necator americanus TaxID=51031 RepID=A0ABR1CFB2_NECAM